jgi:protein-disulfide isomerase
MEQDEMDTSRWVGERLSSLDPPADWQPDSSAAFARLRRRDTPRRHRLWLWVSVTATALAACTVILLTSAPRACANPLGCSQPTPSVPSPSPAPPPAPAPSPVARPPHRPAPVLKPNFKESGSPTAPITCELYTDFECPYCATFYLDTVPQLVSGYVETGKVRLIHRDFPLSNHRFARLAARYANAAGEEGYYQVAANKLFRTQAVWSTDGDIDGQLAKVVPPAAMQRVRALVESGPAADDSVEADEALARQNHVDRTPTLVCNRQSISGHIEFSQLQGYLDPLLARQ